MAPDEPDTKQDRPSEGAAAPDPKVAQEAAEAKAGTAGEAGGQAQEEAKLAAEASEPEPAAAEEPAPAPIDEPEPAAAEPEPVAEEAAEAEAEPAAEPAPKRRRRAKAAADEPEKPRRGGAKPTGDKAKAAPTRRRQPAPSGNGKAPVVRAQAKYVRASARKARLVCDHIRGKTVVEARAILAHAPRAVAQDWSKLLESAVANAENNHELIGEELRILAVYADEGPTLKRFRPRAMGRATRIRKRTSHLTITLTPKE